MKRPVLWVVITMTLGALAAGGLAYRRSHQAPDPRYLTAPVERGRLVARVTATGTLSALVTVQVGSQVSGRIAQINVDFNSPVKKGQVIAKIDSQLFLAAVEQARANVAAQTAQVAQARANSRNAELVRRRDRELIAKRLIAQADLDTAEAQADAAQASIAVQEGQLEQAKATLHQATVNLNYTTIVSPTDGVVISRNVDVGQTVAASLQAPTLFTIAEDLRQMQVDTNVAESDVGKLRTDMTATFSVDAFPSERFTGTVKQVRNAPQTVQNVVTYDAVIAVDNSALKLRPGMTANVTFVYAEKHDVVRVPNAALRFRPPSDIAPRAAKPNGRSRGNDSERTVYVLDGGGQPAPRAIVTGVSDGVLTEVVSGPLQPGEQVVTESVGKSAGAQQPPFRRLF
jgi:HlyD family secretion protein